MNADLFLHGVGILNDVKLMFKNFKSNNNKNTNYINYISSIIDNIEHTFETVYGLFKMDQNKFFQNKENLILLIEVIKFFFKINELKMLKKEGFNFYVEKSIYFSQVLKRNEEEEIDDLDKIEYFISKLVLKIYSISRKKKLNKITILILILSKFLKRLHLNSLRMISILQMIL